MTVDYSCVFGMSSGLPELEVGEQVMRIGDGWTLVVIPSLHGIVFWFMVCKLDRQYSYEDAPRYTQEDAISTCQSFAEVSVWKTTRFGDIWDRRQTFNMTALQESVFETWSHQRLVCIGDSIHKVGTFFLFLFFLQTRTSSNSLTFLARLDDCEPWTRRQLRD